MTAVTLAIYLFFNTSGLIFMKYGMEGFVFKPELRHIVGSLNLKLVLGLGLYFLSFLSWMSLINNNDISYIYPIATASVQICIMLASRFILGESVGLYKLIGTAFIIVGIIILNRA